MATPHPLEDIFLHADYRVRLPRGGHATIRVGDPLPAALARLLPASDAGWGFVTAWNPRGETRERRANRMAQRELRDTLRDHHPEARLHAGLGTLGDWREPSLFVAGIGITALDELMLHFGQLAVVYGHGTERAALRWASNSAPSRDGKA